MYSLSINLNIFSISANWRSKWELGVRIDIEFRFRPPNPTKNYRTFKMEVYFSFDCFVFSMLIFVILFDHSSVWSRNFLMIIICTSWKCLPIFSWVLPIYIFCPAPNVKSWVQHWIIPSISNGPSTVGHH